MKDVQKFRHTTTAKERLEIAKKQVREILLAENDVIETYMKLSEAKVSTKAIKLIVADLFDLKEEVLVGREFWDLLGGQGTYESLLNTFEQAGIELRDEIEEKMKTFKEQNIINK